MKARAPASRSAARASTVASPMNATTSSPFPPRRLSARAASNDVTTWSSGNDNSVNRCLRRVAASATPEYRFGRAWSTSRPDIPRAIENRILVRRTTCRSAANAKVAFERTMAARSRGRSPRRRGISPHPTERAWRSAAATAGWAAPLRGGFLFHLEKLHRSMSDHLHQRDRPCSRDAQRATACA